MADSTTEFIDTASHDKFLEEKWSKDVTVARESKLVFASNVNRQYESDLKQGQILRIQTIGDLAARSKSLNAAITYETISESEKLITINTFYYAAFALEDATSPMVSIDLLNAYMPKLGYALAKQEDSDIATMIDSGLISNSVGTMNVDITYDNLVRADQYLNDADAPEDNRVIIISPAQKAGFLKLDQFIHRDYADTRQGMLGSWMGTYPILVTTNTDGSNTAGHDNVMMHKECIGHIQQIQPIVKTDWDIDYFAVKVAALETYGSTVIRDDHGVWMKGS